MGWRWNAGFGLGYLVNNRWRLQDINPRAGRLDLRDQVIEAPLHLRASSINVVERSGTK
jgi:hypothetical protein